MLKSCVTPDGYVVNASGAKVRVAKGWIKSNGEYLLLHIRQKSDRMEDNWWKEIPF
ncbi:MAG: hypothetical protein ACLTSZ_04425 [Lachnospiraceae bacterium]